MVNKNKITDQEAGNGPTLLFRSAPWLVFDKIYDELSRRSTIDVIVQPSGLNRVGAYDSVGVAIRHGAEVFRLRNTDFRRLRGRRYALAFVAVPGVVADGYLALFTIALLVARKAYKIDADLNVTQITAGVVVKIAALYMMRWLKTAGAVLAAPLAVVIGWALRLTRMGPKRRLLYIANDSWQTPLVQSHGVAWVEYFNTEPLLFASFEGMRGSSQTFTPINNVRHVALAYDPSDYRKLIRAAPFLLVLTGWHRVETIHARSYPPAYLGLFVSLLSGVKLLFDTRGAWVEENQLAGYYKGHRLKEKTDAILARAAYRHADTVIAVGPSHAKFITDTYFTKREPVIIHSMVDGRIFTAGLKKQKQTRRELGLAEFKVVGYCGSSAQFKNPEWIVESFVNILRKRDDVKCVIFSADKTWFDIKLDSFDVDKDRFLIISATRPELARYLPCLDCGVLLLQDTPSKNIVFPTKFAEYCAAGVPVYASAHAVDVARVIREDKIGVAAVAAVEDIGPGSMEQALDTFCADREGYRKRCRATMARYFTLESHEEVFRRLWGLRAD